MPEDLQVERLGPAHRRLRQAFRSGVGPLDEYLRTRAGQDQRHGVSVAYLLLDTARGHLAGYYTLSAASIETADLPEDLAAALPRYAAVPAFLIGRLAVDLGYRGRGLGELLIVDAFRRAIELSEAVAAQSVIVDAKDAHARAFYEKYGFQRLRDDPRWLFLPVATVRAIVEEALGAAR